MKWIKLYEEFQLGDLNFMSPKEIQYLFIQECGKKTPDLNLIRVIVENGLVGVNAKGNWGITPLHRAVRGGNVALAEYLISVGADVNAEGFKDRSPLYWAVQKDNVALAEYLISAGAKVDAKDDEGRSPLYYAISKGHKEMQALLKQHGAVL